jgi:esterase/lipase superfamily enzyme
VIERQRTAVAALHAELSRRLALSPRKEAVVFVHGYNTEFDGAVFRCAELSHYMGRQFVPIVYTWPAASAIGPLRGYTHDRESGEFTSFHLRQFLLALAECPGLERVHLVAHSRGCDVATTALRELKLSLGNDPKLAGQRLKLGQVVLAAPDLDWEVTQQRLGADRIPFMARRFTVYVSPNDKAIALSDWLFGSVRRIGQLGHEDLSAIQQTALHSLGTLNVVRVTRTTGGVGHDYFVSDPAVLSDLILLLRDDRPPGVAHGRPVKATDGGFWELDKNYMAPK